MDTKTTSKPTAGDFADAVCDLMAALKGNRTLLAAMHRPESVRKAMLALIDLTAKYAEA